jgi:hypothetical protein
MVIDLMRGTAGWVGEVMCERRTAVISAEREPPTCVW